MSDLATHEEQSRKLFGQNFTHIHQFLDQYNTPFERPFTAYLHRKHLHHWTGIGPVFNLWGLEAAFVAIVHILEDCLGYIPNAEDYENGKVDEFGRPNDLKLQDTQWLRKFTLKAKGAPHETTG